MNKYIFFHIILLLLSITLLFFLKQPWEKEIVSISLLLYLYFIYITFLKTFIKRYYLINLSIIFVLLLGYINLMQECYLNKLIFPGIILIQIICLTFFKFVWQKYRENLTYKVSSTELKDIIEKQFKIENKLEKLQKKNLELETEKILINRIYSQVKIINATLKFDEMIELVKNILADIVKLPNFVLWIKSKEKSETEIPIMHNINSEMQKYIEYLIREKTGEILNNISIYSKIEIKNDINFINKYGKSNLRDVNIFPLIIKNEQIGMILSFEYNNEQIKESVLEYTKIAIPQIAMGLKKALLYEKVEELSQKDGLTKLFLHRVFQEKLTEEFNRAKRYKEKFSLIMLDIDHFKKFNDTYGHLMGDKVLVMVADTILSIIEPPTIAARYGGEEFAIICPNFTIKEAFELAENIRKSIETKKISVDRKQIGVTVSCGVAQFTQNMKTKDKLISQADKALYQAKEEGRNRTKIFSKKS